MNDKQRLELQRAKIILSGVTGLEDDDEDGIKDAYKALCRLLDQPGSEPVQALQCAHCQVTIETLNDKVMRTLAEVERLKAAQPALPPMHASGLVAIKTLLNRDPCAHAKLAIEMIDAMLAADPQPVPVKTYHDGKPWPVQPAPNMTHASDEWALTNQILRGDA